MEIWKIGGEARDCGDAAARWVTEAAGARKQLRLVRFERTLAPRMANDQASWGTESGKPVYPEGTRLAFADSAHAHVLSVKSLKDLNRRLPQDVGARRFRANIVVDGTDEPYEEDLWKTFKIGDNPITTSRLCSRCGIANIDPAEAKMNTKHVDPLKELRKYRLHTHLHNVDERHGEAPVFGTKACFDETRGVIKQGDTLSVLAYRDDGDRPF